MKKIFLLATFFAIYSNIHAQGSKTELVTIITSNGDSVQLSTSLKYFNGKYIFADDNQYFVKGKVKGEKVEIPKTAITKIKLLNGTTFLAVFNSGGKVIGHYVSKGSTDFFKSYSYGTQDFGYGTVQSYNNVLTENYFTLSNSSMRVYPFEKEDFKQLTEDCQSFSEYMATKKRIKDKEIEATMKLYNELCD
ncbi:MAG: hypothetical protein OCD76_24625 [Reichenbachiella sp.]